jgi:deoxycytidylate deaminase
MKDSWMQTFIKELELYANHATCADIYVSALVIDETYPTALSKGYNGTPRGIIHCEELNDLIVRFAERYNPSQIAGFIDSEGVLNEKGVKETSEFIGRYKDNHAAIVAGRQLLSLSRMDDDTLKSLTGNKLTRLNANIIHYRWEIHAEANALGKIGYLDLNDKRYSIMINWSPCFECAKNIIARGLKRVYYRNEFVDPRWDDSSVEFMKLSGVDIIKF